PTTNSPLYLHDALPICPIPVDASNTPLALHKKWSGHLAAHCWLWKDHTSVKEASEITALAAKIRPNYIAKCGNTYSSEWFWSKRSEEHTSELQSRENLV